MPFDALRVIKGLGLGGSPHLGRDTNNLPSATNLDLIKRVSDLEETIRIIREESESKSVVVVNQAFRSRVDILAWMKIYADNSTGYLQFVDPRAFARTCLQVS